MKVVIDVDHLNADTGKSREEWLFELERLLRLPMWRADSLALELAFHQFVNAGIQELEHFAPPLDSDKLDDLCQEFAALLRRLADKWESGDNGRPA